ncbi:MAG TPA: hypothetical protein VKQ28_15795 [Candidatus Acidoferrum sp.]|nr:hypothetical protein [Candidatus Acidoferrum sp.]
MGNPSEVIRPLMNLRPLAIAVLFASPCFAQETKTLPQAPKLHFNRRVFFIGVSALAAARTFDAIETRRVLDRGGYENNPFFGCHPSSAKQGLITAAFFAGESFLFYKSERSNKRYLRWAGRINLSFTTEEHLRYAACGAEMRKCLGNGLF